MNMRLMFIETTRMLLPAENASSKIIANIIMDYHVLIKHVVRSSISIKL